MALYSVLEPSDFDAVAAAYGLDRPVQAHGVPEGSINTNYRLITPSRRYFLRHTTVRSEDDLRFEANLLRHLAAGACPVPQLLWTRDGAPFLPLAGGRVSVFAYLPGEELSRAELTPDHLERLGAEVGKLHRVANAFLGDRGNPYSRDVVGGWLRELELHRDPELRAIATELLGHLDRTGPATHLVPQGVIHADIFLDNVKWLAGRVAAIFDFEMACRDALVLDIAITVNAWCFDGRYDRALASSFVRGYQDERRLAEPERAHLFEHALFGAIRYTASRIRDFHLSPLGPDRLFPKDFRTYLARVRALAAMGPAGYRDLLML